MISDNLLEGENELDLGYMYVGHLTDFISPTIESYNNDVQRWRSDMTSMPEDVLDVVLAGQRRTNGNTHVRVDEVSIRTKNRQEVGRSGFCVEQTRVGSSRIASDCRPRDDESPIELRMALPRGIPDESRLITCRPSVRAFSPRACTDSSATETTDLTWCMVIQWAWYAAATL